MDIGLMIVNYDFSFIFNENFANGPRFFVFFFHRKMQRELANDTIVHVACLPSNSRSCVYINQDFWLHIHE